MEPAVTDRILSVQDICRKVNLGKSRLYEMIANGDFPPLVQISKGRVGGRESVIDDWIRTRPIVNIRKPSPSKDSSGTDQPGIAA